MPIKVIISRAYLPSETKGALFVMDGCDKYLELVTLELRYMGNMVNVSCIPPGEYPMSKMIRPNGDLAFLIENVPGRTAIEMHVANFAAGKKIDLKGCIAPGMRFADINKDGFDDVESSTIAMDLLQRVLPDRCKLIII